MYLSILSNISVTFFGFMVQQTFTKQKSCLLQRAPSTQATSGSRGLEEAGKVICSFPLPQGRASSWQMTIIHHVRTSSSRQQSPARVFPDKSPEPFLL